MTDQPKSRLAYTSEVQPDRRVRLVPQDTAPEPVRAHRKPKTKKRRPRLSDSREPDLASIVPDPLAWARALELADGDAARLETVSVTTVTVHNSADWRRRQGSRPRLRADGEGR